MVTGSHFSFFIFYFVHKLKNQLQKNPKFNQPGLTNAPWVEINTPHEFFILEEYIEYKEKLVDVNI